MIWSALADAPVIFHFACNAFIVFGGFLS